MRYAFILLTAVMIFTARPYTQSVYAVSESSEWSSKYIKTAINEGFLDSGMQSGYTEYITRGDFCEIVYNMLLKWGIDTKISSGVFKDTDSKAVNALHTMGIVNGKSEKYFAPNDSITREEAATILARIAMFMDISGTSTGFVFDDDANISEWARSYVYKMYSCGVMNGMSDGIFAPKSRYTKEQAIVTIVRLYDIGK
ncbi:MAG: S-layer homology domain-containing protein [Oscillospiraceae bacterium]|nr:S-layer homology domain-containing protein [Oscillospiraceae bacterium]